MLTYKLKINVTLETKLEAFYYEYKSCKHNQSNLTIKIQLDEKILLMAILFMFQAICTLTGVFDDGLLQVI